MDVGQQADRICAHSAQIEARRPHLAAESRAHSPLSPSDDHRKARPGGDSVKPATTDIGDLDSRVVARQGSA